jgi:hypothetical protein
MVFLVYLFMYFMRRNEQSMKKRLIYTFRIKEVDTHKWLSGVPLGSIGGNMTIDESRSRNFLLIGAFGV